MVKEIKGGKEVVKVDKKGKEVVDADKSRRVVFKIRVRSFEEKKVVQQLTNVRAT